MVFTLLHIFIFFNVSYHSYATLLLKGDEILKYRRVLLKFSGEGFRLDYRRRELEFPKTEYQSP